MPINSVPINAETINGSEEGGIAVSGVRQFEADFETPTHHVIGTSTTRRPDAVSFDYLTAFSKGPLAIEDTSQGLEARTWYVRADDDRKLWIARSNAAGNAWEAETLLLDYAFSGASLIVELDLAFDEDGRPVVVAERPSGDEDAPQLWIYHFNTNFDDMTFESHGSGRTPRCILDLFPISPNPDVCPWPLDVQIVYLKPESGMIRLEQRDNFETEHETPLTENENLFLEEIYPTASRRLSVIYSRRQPSSGTYELLRVSSRPYADSLLSRPYFQVGLVSDLTWYRGELFRDPPSSSSTSNYTLRIVVVEECDYIELQCADSIPSGPQPDSGGIWTVQNQTSTSPPINTGGFRTFDVSVTHGGGGMSPMAFRVRVRKTIGGHTCYSPWRYWIAGLEGIPDERIISASLLNCNRDANVCFPCPGQDDPFIYERSYVDHGAHPCDGEEHHSTYSCPGFCGIFVGGWQPSSPFLWRQDWMVRVRSKQIVGFSDSHQSYGFTLYGRVFKSAASGSGVGFEAGSEDQSPLLIPEDL